MCQTAACNRHHSIEQQLCRWLLLTLDRLPSNELVMTQELVAGALGVRRESITEAAGNLQRAGIVRYRRGHISVLERPGLEAGACECYAVVKKEMARLLSDVRYRQEPSAVTGLRRFAGRCSGKRGNARIGNRCSRTIGEQVVARPPAGCAQYRARPGSNPRKNHHEIFDRHCSSLVRAGVERM